MASNKPIVNTPKKGLILLLFFVLFLFFFIDSADLYSVGVNEVCGRGEQLFPITTMFLFSPPGKTQSEHWTFETTNTKKV